MAELSPVADTRVRWNKCTRFCYSTRGIGQGLGSQPSRYLLAAFLPQIGGFRILGEYDGKGMNIGTRLPLTRDYTVNFAVTQVEKILKFGKTTSTEFPGISMGLTINFPRKIPEEIIERPIGLPYAERSYS